MAFTGMVFSAVPTESLNRMRIRLILNRLKIAPHQSESESDRLVLKLYFSVLMTSKEVYNKFTVQTLILQYDHPWSVVQCKV